MRYIVFLFSVFIFLSTSFVYGFVPSTSNSITSIKTEKEEIKKKDSNINSEKQNQKQFKKAIRKAIFQKYNTRLFKKKEIDKNSLDDSKKASTVSKISLVSSIASIVFAGTIYIGIALLIIGVITGIIGLITRDKDKHNFKKTTLFSSVSIVLGIIVVLALLYFALTFRISL